MHVKAETGDEPLVVGVLFDGSEYGTNAEVHPHGRETLTQSDELSNAVARMSVFLAETRSVIPKTDSF